jgi:sugar phosphate isomerase/epimerase
MLAARKGPPTPLSGIPGIRGGDHERARARPGLIAHIQVNDPNRRGPGQGDMKFKPILAALKRHHYAGVIAVEPFDYVPGGPGVAAFSAGYLRGLLEASG